MSTVDLVCAIMCGVVLYVFAAVPAGMLLGSLVDNASRRRLQRSMTWDEERRVALLGGVLWPLLAPLLVTYGGWRLAALLRVEFGGAIRVIGDVARGGEVKELPEAKVVRR